MDGGIGDQTMLADLLASRLELRLDQRDDVAAGLEDRRKDRKSVV